MNHHLFSLTINFGLTVHFRGGQLTNSSDAPIVSVSANNFEKPQLSPLDLTILFDTLSNNFVQYFYGKC